jgi:hypothetical protein
MPLFSFIFASATTSVDWCVKRNEIRQSTSMKTNDMGEEREREQECDGEAHRAENKTSTKRKSINFLFYFLTVGLRRSGRAKSKKMKL